MEGLLKIKITFVLLPELISTHPIHVYYPVPVTFLYVILPPGQDLHFLLGHISPDADIHRVLLYNL